MDMDADDRITIDEFMTALTRTYAEKCQAEDQVTADAWMKHLLHGLAAQGFHQLSAKQQWGRVKVDIKMNRLRLTRPKLAQRRRLPLPHEGQWTTLTEDEPTVPKNIVADLHKVAPFRSRLGFVSSRWCCHGDLCVMGLATARGWLEPDPFRNIPHQDEAPPQTDTNPNALSVSIICICNPALSFASSKIPGMSHPMVDYHDWIGAWENAKGVAPPGWFQEALSIFEATINP